MKINRIALCIWLYLAGITVTYGHIVNENRVAEAECQKEATNEFQKSDCAMAYTLGDIFESIFWPSHWSDVAWRNR
jgi:hypothetical protein